MTCTCLSFFTSRFLLCKHIVQGFHPVSPKFFLKVTRNRTALYWSHPLLRCLNSITEQERVETRTIEQESSVADDEDGVMVDGEDEPPSG